VLVQDTNQIVTMPKEAMGRLSVVTFTSPKERCCTFLLDKKELIPQVRILAVALVAVVDLLSIMLPQIPILSSPLAVVVVWEPVMVLEQMDSLD
jgi:hypothetical protein